MAPSQARKRGEPGARANGCQQPWLIVNVGAKMKTTFTILFSAFVFSGVLHAADAILFESTDYHFVVTACSVRPTEKEEKKVSLAITYEVPKNARFIVFGSRSQTLEPLADPLFFQELKSTPKGELKFAFESGDEPTVFFVGLWRGVGGGSPSGIVCDGAMVSLPLKITPVFRHEK